MSLPTIFLNLEVQTVHLKNGRLYGHMRYLGRLSQHADVLSAYTSNLRTAPEKQSDKTISLGKDFQSKGNN